MGVAEVVIAVAVVLAIIAVIGHGLWVAVALVFRGLFGRGETPPARRDSLPQRLEFAPNDLAELARMQRNLQRLRDDGALDAETVNRLLDQLEVHRRRVLSGRWHPVAKTPEIVPPPLGPRPSEPIVLELVEEPKPPPIPPRVAPPVAKPLAPPVKAPPSAQQPITPAAGAPLVPAPHAKPPASPRKAAALEALAAASGAPSSAPQQAAPPQLAPQIEPPAPPRQHFAEILASFMEERNIRWGELVGGLLFVGGSIALVISLWEKLQQIPYYQFFVFVAVSAAMFGVGLYTHHRWKLASTSRGLLIIATLLVPLNFAVMAGTSRDQVDLLAVLLQIAALLIFIALVSQAASVLVGHWRWWMTASVLGCSASLLLVRPAPPTPLLLLLAALPAAFHSIPLARVLSAESREPHWDEARTNRMFTLLGTATFALAVALGLLVVRSTDRSATLDYLSVFVALAAAPVTAGGFAVMRGTGHGDELAGHRTAGTAVALVGLMALLVAVGLAWPRPLFVLVVGAVDAAALALVAFRYRMPAAHALAIACAALVYLVGFHLLWGNLRGMADEDLDRRMFELAITAQSGTSLVGFFLLLGVLTEVIARSGRRADAAWYAGGCVVAALVSLLLVTARGYTEAGADALRALIVYGIYGGGSLALNARWRQPLASYVGLVLQVCASLWALWWRDPHVHQGWAALVALESLAMAVLASALAAGRTSAARTLIDAYRWPLRHVAEAAVLLAIGIALAAPDLTASRFPMFSAAAVAATVLLSAWEYKQPGLSLAGSGLVLAALVHAIGFRYADWFRYPWTTAFLAHATLAVAATLALRAIVRGRQQRPADETSSERPAGWIHKVFSEPIGASGLASSLVGLLLLFWFAWSEPLAIALLLYWLAALWLVLSLANRSQPLFSSFQVVLAAAVVFSATHWLQDQPWVIAQANGLADPRSLQTYGVCLGLLCLLWLVVRIATHGVGLGRYLLNPPWPAVDRVLLYALVGASVLSTAWGVWPEIGRELARAAPRLAAAQGVIPPVAAGVRAAAFAPGAWWLSAVLGAALVACLLDRWRVAEALAAAALAIGAACLVAGRYDVQLAVASSLRWNLAAVLLLVSAAVWIRAPLAAMLRGVQCRLEIGAEGPVLTRGLLWIGCVLPVLWLTARVAWLGFQRATPAGPMPGSVFADAGLVVNNIAPLVLIVLALAGHAAGELSPEYAFAAGLVAEATVAGGYALGVITRGGRIDSTELVRILQAGTLMAAAWAIGWLAARPPLIARRPQAASPLSDVFLRLQVAQAAVGNLLLLVFAFLLIAVTFDRSEAWTTEAGSPLGWVTLAIAVGAGWFRIRQKQTRMRPETVGLLGLAAMGLIACSIARAMPDTPWGYRALMLGWSLYAISVVAATWWAAILYAPPGAWGVPRELVRTAALWVRVAGILAVLLGLKAAVLHPEDTLWAAAAIALASAAGAAMAVWLRREGWAFTAGLGVNLAASLVAWRELPVGASDAQWWTWFVQANVVAGGAVSLLWLAARRRLYAQRGLTVSAGPLLVLQVALVAAAEACLVTAPLYSLVQEPRGLNALVVIGGHWAGWVAWALALAAVAVYVWQIEARQLLHVLCAFAVAGGVLVGCSLAARRGEAWLAYHALTTSWTVVDTVLIGVLWFGQREVRKRIESQDRAASAYHDLVLFRSTHSIEWWISAIGLAVVALAVRGATDDPQHPYWSAGAVLAISAVAGVAALLVNKPRYVYASGMLLNVAGSVVWLTWQDHTLTELALVNVAAFAVAGIVWTMVGIALSAVTGAEEQGWPRYEQLATCSALAILAVLAAIVLGDNVLGNRLHLPETLTWTAWGLAAAAAFVSLWDARAALALANVYAAGAIGIGIELARRELGRIELGWHAGLAIAGFVLVATIVARMATTLAAVGRAFGLPSQRRPLVTQWFSPAQAVFSLAAAGLGAWMAVDFAQLADRLGGALAVLMLLPAAVLTARGRGATRRTSWEDGSIGLGVLTLASFGCAWLDPAGPARWLHDGVVVLAAAGVMIAVSGFALARLPARFAAWTVAGRRNMPSIGMLALIALAAVLWQEWMLFSPADTQHPMAPWAIVVVAVVLLALVAACLAFAVFAQRDPLGLTDRGRTIYVYAAEAIALVIVGHLRMTVPWLFQLGIIENYWTLIVMVVAFAGAGLAEWFQRRNLPVLAEPLVRTAMLVPLLPVVVVLARYLPDVGIQFSPGKEVAGEAVLFLVAVFYGFLAVTRRSFALGALSVVSANTGLWVLWTRLRIQFLFHPQLWLIPIALAALIAEQMNRRRLTSAQSNAIRYMGLAVIYLSSAADLYVARRDNVHFVPMVLALMALSIVGVLAGITLRVRSFLYLGVAALLVDLCAVIYHATVDLGHMWVLWSSIILVGTLILALFAFFEKRRNDLRAALERFKEWE